MIARMTDAYVRHYRDNDSWSVIAEWVDDRGSPGSTSGSLKDCGHADCYRADHILGAHMAALFARAGREGIQIHGETWGN